MSIFQADPLFRLDAVQRAEDFAAEPNFWDFPTHDEWLAYMDASYPLPQAAEWTARLEAYTAALDARIAALDGLGDCARWARMVLAAWREGQP